MVAGGIDVGGTKVLGVVLDDEQRVVRVERAATPQGAEALVQVLAQVAVALGPVARLGVGVAGLVTRDGVLRSGPNLPGITELRLADELGDRLGRAVTVENDATCACFAEWQLGAGRGANDLALITLGTGIGAGFVVGGELQRGSQGFAGEPGHMIVDPNGRPCVCGQRGCWERYASGSGLADIARDLMGPDAPPVTAEDVEESARAGDATALAALDRFAWWVALGLVNVINILDPEVVVLGGGAAAVLDLTLGPIERHLAELIYASDHRALPRIVPAALGEQAGAIGAALFAAAAQPRIAVA